MDTQHPYTDAQIKEIFANYSEDYLTESDPGFSDCYSNPNYNIVSGECLNSGNHTILFGRTSDNKYISVQVGPNYNSSYSESFICTLDTNGVTECNYEIH